MPRGINVFRAWDAIFIRACPGGMPEQWARNVAYFTRGTATILLVVFGFEQNVVDRNIFDISCMRVLL